ncbi:MAG: hypothetical protein ACRCVV_14765 [Shewanella sp.]|uniref:hypothetical protein n=1 Tax=Aeromonas popoffii TaxID=70856 RepID=UPI003F3E3B69
MIDLDVIEKECQQMISDGLGFIAPKSCADASAIAVLVEMMRVEQRKAETFKLALQAAGKTAFISGDVEVSEAIKGILQCEQ